MVLGMPNSTQSLSDSLNFNDDLKLYPKVYSVPLCRFLVQYKKGMQAGLVEPD